MNFQSSRGIWTRLISAAMRRSLVHLDEQKIKVWGRSLSVGDLLNDRWERASRYGFGEGSSVYDSCLILGKVRVGKNVWIGPHTILDGSGGLEIGDNCTVSAGVQIYTHDTVRRTLSGGHLPTEHDKVLIGNNCYIGPQAIITKGVVIGDQVVIGAGSFVNRNIEARSFVLGTPARVQSHDTSVTFGLEETQ